MYLCIYSGDLYRFASDSQLDPISDTVRELAKSTSTCGYLKGVKYGLKFHHEDLNKVGYWDVDYQGSVGRKVIYSLITALYLYKAAVSLWYLSTFCRVSR